MKRFKQSFFFITILSSLVYMQSSFACGYGDDMKYGPCLDQRIQDDQRRNADTKAAQAANNAEAQRQWQIREDAVQARIAKYRATPSYGAIAVSDIDSSMGGGLGYKTKEVAIEHAIQACKVGNCRIISTFSNTCAGVANLIGSKNPNTLVVAIDTNPSTALKTAYAQCEVKYGKDNCGMRNESKAFCAGYDYGTFIK